MSINISDHDLVYAVRKTKQLHGQSHLLITFPDFKRFNETDFLKEFTHVP